MTEPIQLLLCKSRRSHFLTSFAQLLQSNSRFNAPRCRSYFKQSQPASTICLEDMRLYPGRSGQYFSKLYGKSCFQIWQRYHRKTILSKTMSCQLTNKSETDVKNTIVSRNRTVSSSEKLALFPSLITLTSASVGEQVSYHAQLPLCERRFLKNANAVLIGEVEVVPAMYRAEGWLHLGQHQSACWEIINKAAQIINALDTASRR